MADDMSSLEPLLLDQRQEAEADEPSPRQLDRKLSFLYCLNGVTLALPTTALLWTVNTQTAIPVHILPSYAAISFLPFSLKPLYALASNLCGLKRDSLLSLLLLLHALAILLTSLLLKPGTVVLCFGLAFLRGLTSAWPEFLLGLSLIDQASSMTGTYSINAARFQAQAATARNVGSTVAHALTVAWLVTESELQQRQAHILLMTTAVITVTGAFVTLLWKHPLSGIRQQTPPRATYSSSPSSHQSTEEQDPLWQPEESSSRTHSDCHCDTQVSSLGGLVAWLQLSVLLLVLRPVPVNATGRIAWFVFMGFSLLVLLLQITTTEEKRSRVGLCLMLRQAAVPSLSYVMTSFIYSALEKHGSLFQLLSVTDMAVTLGASWSYGKVLSDRPLGWTMAGTTALAAVASLSNVPLVHLLATDHSLIAKVVWTITIRSLVTWTNEWKILPDIILATVSVDTRGSHDASRTEATERLLDAERRNHCEREAQEEHSFPDESLNHKSLQYGTLLSCVDFGGQIGTFLASPLVGWFGTSRDNNWAHLDQLLALNSCFVLFSVSFLLLLKNECSLTKN
jgi:hypothetical protein